MNVEELFKKYSIEEISEKTKISPISLKLIKNKEFEKIPRAKFLGFIKIIENELNIDLSELKEEYEEAQKTSTPPKPPTNNTKPPKNNTHLITILAIFLLLIGGFSLYKNINTKEEINTTTISSIEIPKTPEPKEKNTTHITKTPIKTLEKNQTKKVTKKYPVVILPNKLVWFRAKNIDTNKTIETLTSKIKYLEKGNYYIKFGHGDIKIQYNNQIITPPNPKRIVRILLKDGNYTFLKKPNRYEK